MARMGLSIGEYADHRRALGLTGGAKSAVHKAIKSGRIRTLPDGSIDPKIADRDWEERTDPARQRGKAAMRAGAEKAKATRAEDVRKPVPKEAIDAVNETLREVCAEPDDDELSALGGTGVSMKNAVLADKILSARLKKEKLKREQGEVVDRGRATQLIFDLARRERDAWTGWPARVAANMAAELQVDPHLLERVLDRFLREQLAQMPQVDVDLR